VKLDLGERLQEGVVSENEQRVGSTRNDSTSASETETHDLLGLSGVLANGTEGLASERHV
jgi:hypothetical protein